MARQKLSQKDQMFLWMGTASLPEVEEQYRRMAAVVLSRRRASQVTKRSEVPTKKKPDNGPL